MEARPLLTTVRKILAHEMTIAEWIGTAIIIGIPYLVVGLIWSSTRIEDLDGLHGADFAVSFLGSIVSWPALLVSSVCMT
jgi:hypothetical protein